jgi:hypothetical protein
LTPPLRGVFGRVHPERADVSFGEQVWRNSRGDAITISCESSQIHVRADFVEEASHLDAFVNCEHVAQAVLGALGFAPGTGYSVEFLQAVDESGTPQVLGARPGNLGFDDWQPVFETASELAKGDARFRLALRDYARAMTQALDCAHYCYRAVEAIRSAFGEGASGWKGMHSALSTDESAIRQTLKVHADPIRHGDWLAFEPTTAPERNEMLQVTRDVLLKYLDWKRAA